MTVQFQGPGGFNEEYFSKRFGAKASSKLADGSSVNSILADKQLTAKELHALRQDYLIQAGKAGLSSEQALQQFSHFLTDSLDGQLGQSLNQRHLDVITDLGFLFEDDAAIALGQDEQGGLLLETGTLDAQGFQQSDFSSLVNSAANASARQEQIQTLWETSLASLKGHVFRAADNTEGRYTSPETLIARHRAAASHQHNLLTELKTTLYQLAGQPGADQLPLSEEISRYQDLADLLAINIRVHETFSARSKQWKTHNLQVDTQALSQLNHLLTELELFKVRLAPTPKGQELREQWQDLRNTVQAVTSALGNHQYTAMRSKQPLDLHVTATAQRYEIHKLDVQQKERRDVDATPQGFVKAKVFEGQYDDAYAFKISQMLDELDKVPAQDFEIRAKTIRGRIADLFRSEIIGDPAYRQSILDLVDARVISRGVQLRLPGYQEKYAKLTQAHLDLPGLPQKIETSKAPQYKSDNTDAVRPLLPTWRRTAEADDPIEQIQVHDKGLAALRQETSEANLALDDSDSKAQAAASYVSEARLGGSSVGQLLTGKSAAIQAENQQSRETLDKIENGSATMAKEAAASESKLWKGKLAKADETYLRRIFNAATRAKEGTALHNLGLCYQAMGLYQEGGKWQDKIDLNKLQAKIAEYAKNPEVQKAFDAIKQDIAREYYTPKEVEQIAEHLRSGEFREFLFSLPPERQQEELQRNLRVLEFADPALAASISEELANAYVLERPETVLDQLTPHEKRSAFELALNQLGESGALIARGGTAVRTAKDMMILSAVGKAKIAEALAAIPAKELRTCFDHVDLMRILSKQLHAMGTDMVAISDDLATLSKLGKAGRLSGFSLTAAAAVGHIGEGLLSGELIQSLQAYGAKLAQGVGGMFAKGTDMGQLAKAVDAGSDLGDLSKVADLTGDISSVSDVANLGKMAKGFKWPTWINKAGGQVGKIAKFLGPVGEAWGIYSDTKGLFKEIKNGDYFGAGMKGVQAGAGMTGLGTGLLIAAGCAGPGAPLVVAGALVVGIGAWILDASFAKSDEQSLLENLGVYQAN